MKLFASLRRRAAKEAESAIVPVLRRIQTTIADTESSNISTVAPTASYKQPLMVATPMWIPIQAPLPHISVNIVNSPVVRLACANLVWLSSAVRHIPSVVSEAHLTIPAEPPRRHARLRRELPLRQSWQVERFKPRPLTQPTNEAVGVDLVRVRPVLTVRVAANGIVGDISLRLRGGG